MVCLPIAGLMLAVSGQVQGEGLTAAIGGRLMVDAAFFRDDVSDQPSGTELRRARIGIEGDSPDGWAYQAEYDFAGNEAEVKDAWIGRRRPDGSRIRIGQFKEPFSLEEQTSSRYITFLERALPNAFAPGRAIGLGYHNGGDGGSIAAGAFGEAVGETEDDESYSAGLRLTRVLGRADYIIHFGVAANYRAGMDAIDLSERPEAHLAESLIPTGDIATDAVVRTGLELASVNGPRSLQAEYVRTTLRRSGGDATFSGYYLYASWFVTGESRRYRPARGKFARVTPTAGSGAWEWALRLSTLDLEDGPFDGGHQRNMTIGTNWYANARTRFMANYVVVDTRPRDDLRALLFRAQVDF